jgi:DNA-binding transcriptional LysR family regulator
MSYVSADTKRPSLLVCVHHLSPAAQGIIANEVFCVNVLRDDQSYISDCFAGRFKMPDGDKFSCVGWTTQTTGAPRALDPLVAFDCRLVSHLKIGTHFVFFGEVEDLFIGDVGSPLIYANRAYATPARHNPRSDETTRVTETLRLGAFHTFGPHLVPELLERLAVRGHNVDLKLLEGDQRRILEGLKAGEIDIALVYDFDLGGGLDAEPLAALQPYVLLPENHPLTIKPALSFAELAREPFILLDAPPSARYFLSLFEAEGIEPKVRFRTPSFEMVRSFVAHGFGYSLLTTKPASATSYDGRPLATRPLTHPVAPSCLVLVSRAQGRLGPVAAAFRQICLDFFAGQRTTAFAYRS